MKPKISYGFLKHLLPEIDFKTLHTIHWKDRAGLWLAMLCYSLLYKDRKIHAPIAKSS